MIKEKTSEKSATMTKTKVLVVDDHPIVRHGLAGLIQMQKDFTVCGSARDVPEALAAIKKIKPDMAVIDLSLDKDLGGIELIKDIRSQYPEINILVISMHNENIFAERVLRAGAKGYVMKEETPETVVNAICQVASGGIYLSNKMASKLLVSLTGGKHSGSESATNSLTDRELEVLELIGTGFGASKIAEKLHLSVKTIESYREHIKKKLQIKNAGELRQYAIEWVKGEDVV